MARSCSRVARRLGRAVWAAGLILEWTGLNAVSPAAFTLGLAAGAWTFVPGTLTRLFTAKGRGRPGAGLLTTIAAIGSVLLGRIGEATALAFLFSISETLEDRAMDRAQQGLHSPLSLIPKTARISSPPKSRSSRSPRFANRTCSSWVPGSGSPPTAWRPRTAHGRIHPRSPGNRSPSSSAPAIRSRPGRSTARTLCV